MRIRGTLVLLEEVFTAVEVATTIEGIKSGKAAGEDEIRPTSADQTRNSLVNASVSSYVKD